MNFRSPFLNPIALVGIFLALFWTAGLLLTLERTPRVDDAFVLPTLKAATTADIDSVVVERSGKDGGEYRFARKGEDWTLQQGSQSIKIEGYRIRDLIREIREARRDAEVRVSGSLASHGLQPPQTTVTLSGRLKRKDAPGAEREWKLLLGNESSDKKFVYATTSDRPGVVVALPRNTLNAVFFKNANDLRSKRLFDFSEPTVQALSIKDGASELEVKKTKDGGWLLVKPNLGFAEFEGQPAKGGEKASEKASEGIKSLLAAIAAVRVDSEDDFVPPAADTLDRNDLVAGKEKIRIQISSGDTTKPADETLLIGRQDNGYYFARLATDEGAFKLPVKTLAPILEALKSPEKLRNLDVSPVTLKDADAVTLTLGKDTARFTLGGEPRQWSIALNDSAPTAANNKAVESLLDALQGRNGIIAFQDVPTADGAKADAELGFDLPQASVAVYLQGTESSRDPKLAKDAKPTITLQFGKTDKDHVWVKRTMPDGPPARFTVAKSVFEKIVPREGMIGYMELMLPKLIPQNISRIEIQRGGKVVTLDKKDNRWYLKDAAGEIPADARKTEDLVRAFSALPVRRWVRKLDAKDDLAPLGLKSPDVTLTLTLKNSQIGADAISIALGQLGSIMTGPSLAALAAAWSNWQLGGEKVVVKFGKEPTESEDAGNLYVQHSQTDRLSLAPTVFANLLRSVDLRDRSTILQPHALLVAATIGAPAADALAGITSASPLVTCQLGKSDASQVKSLRITVRTPIEVRTFAFNRDGKGWTDQSGLKEFQIDEQHVGAVAELVAQLGVNRIVALTGGAREDQKLSAKEASVVIDGVMTDLRPVNITIGANFEGLGYFTQISTWPGAIFLLSPDRVQPLLGGAAYFAKERVASQ
ncbi:MAG: DUF4340 domain-containing protein [Planctomycetota bacterium]